MTLNLYSSASTLLMLVFRCAHLPCMVLGIKPRASDLLGILRLTSLIWFNSFISHIEVDTHAYVFLIIDNFTCTWCILIIFNPLSLFFNLFPHVLWTPSFQQALPLYPCLLLFTQLLAWASVWGDLWERGQLTSGYTSNKDDPPPNSQSLLIWGQGLRS